MASPVVVKPVDVVEAPGITITECFGRVASKDGTCSLGMAVVKGASEEAWQAPGFDEYVICNQGTIEFLYGHAGAESVRISAGEGVFLPRGLRVKWKWLEACKYTVLCLPAFSPELSGREDEEGATVAKSSESMQKLAALHAASGKAEDATCQDVAKPADAKPTVFKPVNVVEAPGITITEYFGHVASHDGTCSLGTAVVKGASEEAWQAPQFDEYVICNEGAIEFLHGESESARICSGEGVFLPKNLRVKWKWLEACKYTVLCLPAFAPDLSGREEEESATVAKSSESMRKLEELHKKTRLA
eukprot:TRINITY_DN24165_c0_g1_i1.p1 TRINITY_DN24165_c0_g1~~TRINITY_DN24165_c0_g1_i1.p1  ORF type:complete len:303 (-),score=77.91 TRINITY_DN24165_c0_g1_i1:195-1103(-)